MPGDQNRDYSKYDAMATEELEEILRLDAGSPEGEVSDAELLLYVMGVLANRRNTDITGKTALESWESFQGSYLEEECSEAMQGHEPSRTAAPWLRRLIAAAAVIALAVGIPLSARAFAREDLWNIFARWAKETFSFVSEESAGVTEPDKVYNGKLTSLRELLEQAEHDPSIVPAWIPDGFELESLERDATPMQEVYCAFYLKGDKELTIRVQTYIDDEFQKMEINEDLIELYDPSDTEYYIFSNDQKLRAVWTKDTYECYITGDLTLEEIKLMIDSVGKG